MGAIISVVLALLFVFLYIFVRLETGNLVWVLLLLTHDVLIVLGIFSLLHGIVFLIRNGQSFIAAIPSNWYINDTVIVFDRV